MSVVYFLQVEGNGPIKIGYTTGCVYTRVEALQQASPYILKWIGAFEGGRPEETAAHRLLKNSRSRGEWFHPTTEVLQFVKHKTDPGFDPAKYRDTIFCETERQIVLRQIRPWDRDRASLAQELCAAIKWDPYNLHGWLSRNRSPPRDKATAAAAYVQSLSSSDRVAS